MLLSFLLISLSLTFSTIFIWRIRRKLFCLDLDARVLKVEEGFVDVKQQYYSIKHFYPKLEYEYSIDGESYVGSTGKYDIRRYMVPEIDNLGNKKSAKDFFWRSYTTESSIPILVKAKNLSRSIIAVEERAAYRSENTVFALMACVFLLASIYTII